MLLDKIDLITAKLDKLDNLFMDHVAVTYEFYMHLGSPDHGRGCR